MAEWVRIKKGVTPYSGKLLEVKRRYSDGVYGYVRLSAKASAIGERLYLNDEVETTKGPRT